MKKIILLILLSSPLFSQVLFIDDFNYPVIDSLEGTGGWYQSGLNTQYHIKVATPGLTYSGYSGSGTGNTAFIANNPNGDIVLHNFTTQTSGTLYMSFMISVDSMSLNATSGYNIGFDQSGGATNLNTQLYLQKVNQTVFKFGIRKNGSVVYGTLNYNTNTTYVAVVKYTFVAGADNDSAKMYIFNAGIPAAEPSVCDAFSTAGTDLADIGEVFLSNLYGQGTGLNLSSVKIDGIRIGTTWGAMGLTNLTQTTGEVPTGFYLGQNFPNPFNPVTNIYFSIPERQHVSVTIRDMLGKEVSLPVNNNLQAGTYKAVFDLSGLSSGVYFYELETERFREVKKMTLIK